MRRLVLVDAACLVGAGVGLVVSLFTTRALRGLLYGVPPLDPTALAGAVAGILVVSAVPSAVPLRAASRVDPAEVFAPTSSGLTRTGRNESDGLVTGRPGVAG